MYYRQVQVEQCGTWFLEVAQHQLVFQLSVYMSYSIQETSRLELAPGAFAIGHRFLLTLQIPTTSGKFGINSSTNSDNPQPSAHTWVVIDRWITKLRQCGQQVEGTIHTIILLIGY